jgi:hypothetical protein
MIFTVDLRGFGVRYRLQNDGTWRNLRKDSSLLTSDYRTGDSIMVAKKSPGKGTIELDAAVFKINPSEASLTDKVLGSTSSVFRKKFPKVPQLDQLRRTIASGDDSKMNVLILNVYGDFELRTIPPFDFTKNDPTVVVRHETFVAENDCVGAEAAKDSRPIDELYSSSLEFWIKHLKTGKTQEYCDLPAAKKAEDFIAELRSIQQRWVAQY